MSVCVCIRPVHTHTHTRHTMKNHFIIMITIILSCICSLNIVHLIEYATILNHFCLSPNAIQHHHHHHRHRSTGYSSSSGSSINSYKFYRSTGDHYKYENRKTKAQKNMHAAAAAPTPYILLYDVRLYIYFTHNCLYVCSIRTLGTRRGSPSSSFATAILPPLSTATATVPSLSLPPSVTPPLPRIRFILFATEFVKILLALSLHHTTPSSSSFGYVCVCVCVVVDCVAQKQDENGIKS